MNIYAQEDDRVIFSTFDAGYDREVKTMKELGFEIGKVYTIDYTCIYDYNTDVYLKEFPGKSFNSVFFTDYKG